MDLRPIKNDDKLYTTQEVGHHLGVHPAEIRRKVRREILQARRVGKRLKITGTEVHRFISLLPVVGRKDRRS
jgi:excisionase family DNA binding protein